MVEHVGVAEQLPGQLGVTGRELVGEVDGAAPTRRRSSLAIWCSSNGPRPPVGDRLLGIPDLVLTGVEAVEEGRQMPPRQLCTGLVHNSSRSGHTTARARLDRRLRRDQPR